MIPLTLTLRNFMSYGETPTTIDLRDMPVVCLSGDNGHGKSAILDAVTWALWGETRLGRQNHEQLVRLGADEALVVLEFREGDDIYRVRRQRSRRSAAGLWELQIQEAGGAWRPLSGQSAADTGRAIVGVLRMNYETFLNSAFLRQGRADEFVRQTANKRKEILAEILDLSRYDDLEARARAKVKEASDRRIDAERSLQQIEVEIAEEPAFRLALEGAVQALSAARAAEGQSAARAETLAAARAALQARQAQREQFAALVRTTQAQIERYRASLDADSRACVDARKLLDDRQRVESEHRRLAETEAKIQALQVDARRYRDLERRRTQLATEIDKERAALTTQLAQQVQRRDALTAQVSGLGSLRAQLTQLEASQAESADLSARREALWKLRSDIGDEFSTLKADHDALKRELAEAEARLESVRALNSNCSVCGSPLTPEQRELLAAESAEAVKRIAAKVADLKLAGTTKRAEQQQTDLELESVQKALATIESRARDLGSIERQVRDLSEIEHDQLPRIAASIESIERTIGAEQFATQARASLAETLQEHTSLRYAEAECEQLAELVRDLRWATAAHAHLQTAQREFDAAGARIASAEQSIAELERQADAAKEELDRSSSLASEVSDNERALDEARRARVIAREQVQTGEREETLLQNRLSHIETARSLRTERAEQSRSARNDEELYTELAGAFGKRGVQALIIENALPELQNDANELLERITDGELSITIQTTRQAKSKSTGNAPIETLEVAIRDHLGDRPLEMYSGGESFRVAFALRIALSKLLTRRAGAHLQTLIVDEGFGTQDAKGREKLVDAIMAIRDEFAQIIVITHVDELKDAFPNRIEVVKTPTGSELTFIGGSALG